MDDAEIVKTDFANPDIDNEQMTPDDFETTDALRTYTMQLIRSIGLTQSLATNFPSAYDFFRALFQRHPEADRKQVSQIVDIHLQKFPKAQMMHPLPISDHQFVIVKADGTTDTISWMSCINQAVTSPDKILIWAMRYAVKQQIRDYKFRNRDKPCQLCGSRENLTVDHVQKFRDLKAVFLASHPNPPTQFAKNADNQNMFRREDFEFERQWQYFHRNNAVLRILCYHCNVGLDERGDVL